MDADAPESLADIAVRHGSDKITHGFIPLYAAHLAPWRTKPLHLLEIGVGGYDEPTRGGASLRMWADYFPNARIVGLDLREKDLDLPPSVTIVRGSQADPEVLDRLLADHGPFDVVIDDGSHVNAHRNMTFGHLFPCLPIGGLYVFEDLHTSYVREPYGGQSRNLDDPATTTGLLKQMIDGLHHAYVPGREALERDRIVSGFSVYPKIAFVTRGANERPVARSYQRWIDRELEARQGDER
jgi:hypothetical protein